MVITARASGQGINVCLFSLVLLMCRQLVTLLRRLGLHSVIPLDQHVTYHKTCGVLLTLLAIVHTGCHLVNLKTNVVTDTVKNSARYSYSQWLLSILPATFGTIPGQSRRKYPMSCSNLGN